MKTSKVIIISLALTGCSTFETTRQADTHGTIMVSWAFGQQIEGGKCGEVIRLKDKVILRLAGDPPTFNDNRRLECLGHELLHILGGKHK